MEIAIKINGQAVSVEVSVEVYTYLNQVAHKDENMDCFDFYPELSSPEDYARQEFLKRCHIPEDDSEIFQFRTWSADAVTHNKNNRTKI